MNRRDFLKAICVGAAGLSCTGEYGAAKSGSSKPNVLFIAIDDMNDWTTLFDPKNPIKTPNLVRLAKRGMFFIQSRHKSRLKHDAAAKIPICKFTVT